MLRSSLRAVGIFVFSATLLGCSLRGCTGGDGRNDIAPEDQLHAYINTAVNVTKQEQRQELVDLTTGSLKASLINATEETFKRAYIDKKYDFKAFDIVQRNDAPGGKETKIDFKLVYKSWNAGESPNRAPTLETTNRATLEYEHGQWAISKVESLGTSFEWEVGLPMDGVSTKGVNPDDAPKEIESSRDTAAEAQKEQAEEQEKATATDAGDSK